LEALAQPLRSSLEGIGRPLDRNRQRVLLPDVAQVGGGTRLGAILADRAPLELREELREDLGRTVEPVRLEGCDARARGRPRDVLPQQAPGGEVTGMLGDDDRRKLEL